MVTPFVYAMDKEAKAKSYPVPTLELFNKYGFAMELTIEPKEFESGKILKIIYPNGGGKNIRPAEHLAIVMQYVEKDAMKNRIRCNTFRKTRTYRFGQIGRNTNITTDLQNTGRR